MCVYRSRPIKRNISLEHFLIMDINRLYWNS